MIGTRLIEPKDNGNVRSEVHVHTGQLGESKGTLPWKRLADQRQGDSNKAPLNKSLQLSP